MRRIGLRSFYCQYGRRLPSTPALTALQQDIDDLGVTARPPDLRERFRTQLAEELEQDPNEDGRDYLVEQLWPAVIAYAVALATREQERSGHRPPWHVLSDSFEPCRLAGHFRQPAAASTPTIWVSASPWMALSSSCDVACRWSWEAPRSTGEWC
ncbi:hypothetical protein [Streptomyces sp. NPDC055692]|uniref:hypothetical protein n=1 Tax=Streptomyces sp. NPDC055692 TaxID=3155683 RepID=UPI003434624B